MENNLEGGFEAYVRHNNTNENTLSLKVSGVHCAGCIQKIESTLYEQHKDISEARLNFTTGALNIKWVGMDNLANRFVQDVKSLGYGVTPYQKDDKTTNEGRFLLLCLGVAGFATGNIMLLSFGLWITNQETMGMATRDFLHWVSALIAIPCILFSGRPFFQSAWNALRHKRTNMDVPISLALVLATGMSIHELLRGAEHVYFDSALMLCFFLLIGRYLDFRAKSSARSAATDLMSTLSGFATVLENGKSHKIPIRDVKQDMIIQVAVGEKFPVDAIIHDGKTEIDTSLVTGETVPKIADKGDEVFAGTVNMSAPVIIAAMKPAEDSLLADIVRLMEQAEQGQAAYTRLADRAARLYTPLVHTLALAAFLLWFLIIGVAWQDALLIAVTVLIITCPCALGLAVPVAQVLATGQLMKNRILVKTGDALERLAVITHIFTDKTGTLTRGIPTLIGLYNENDLQMAASLACHSAHPFSKAIVAAHDGVLLPVHNIKEVAGQGLEGKYDGKTVRLGNADFTDTKNDGNNNLSIVWLAQDGQNPVSFNIEDSLRPHVKNVIDYFDTEHIKTTLISGDIQQVAAAVATKAGITDIHSGLTPPEKYEMVTQAKSKHYKTLMIGDGLNDAPVLAGADVSIAPGTAIDMAQNVADIVFMGDDFDAVRQVHVMAVRTQKIILTNFTIAVIYNLIAIPLAFLGMVTPMVAAIAMSGSSLLVIMNSFRLRLRA